MNTFFFPHFVIYLFFFFGRSDLEYLKKVAGMRTVPIEVGKTYLEETWSQKLMTLGDFIDQHVGPSSGPTSGPSGPSSDESSPKPTGYLAQTQLFDQIPELRKDIIPNLPLFYSHLFSYSLFLFLLFFFFFLFDL
jgi:hypothetical protein